MKQLLTILCVYALLIGCSTSKQTGKDYITAVSYSLQVRPSWQKHLPAPNYSIVRSDVTGKYALIWTNDGLGIPLAWNGDHVHFSQFSSPRSWYRSKRDCLEMAASHWQDVLADRKKNADGVLPVNY